MTRKHLCAIALAVALCVVTATPAGAAATRMQVDRNHSSVSFRVPILGGLSTVIGKFMEFEIELDYDPDNPSASAVSATVNAASIDTGIEGRDGHLRTADFFDAENHPEITFVSDAVNIADGRGTLSGTLSIRGNAHPVTWDLEVAGIDGRSTGFKATTVIDRTEFGVTWQHGDVPTFVSNDITIELFILASAPSSERP